MFYALNNIMHFMKYKEYNLSYMYWSLNDIVLYLVNKSFNLSYLYSALHDSWILLKKESFNLSYVCCIFKSFVISFIIKAYFFNIMLCASFYIIIHIECITYNLKLLESQMYMYLICILRDNNPIGFQCM